MKKIGKKQVLWTTAILSGAASLISKRPYVKWICGGISVTCGALLVLGETKKEIQKVEKECQETQQAFEESGLDPREVEDIDLLAVEEDEEEAIFGKTLLREAYRGNVFSDDMLEFDLRTAKQFNPNILHVMQNEEKGRIVISIPLQLKKSKNGLSDQDIRGYFEEVFEDFINEYGLDMKPYLNEVGVHVSKGPDENGDLTLTYYEEINREEDETFREYQSRILRYIEKWESKNEHQRQRLCKMFGDNEEQETLRFEHYLVLEFPVFPKKSGRTGLNLLTAMTLLRKLTEIANITVSATRRDTTFEFNKVLFHPDRDYGTIFQLVNGKIEMIEF